MPWGIWVHVTNNFDLHKYGKTIHLSEWGSTCRGKTQKETQFLYCFAKSSLHFLLKWSFSIKDIFEEIFLTCMDTGCCWFCWLFGEHACPGGGVCLYSRWLLKGGSWGGFWKGDFFIMPGSWIGSLIDPLLPKISLSDGSSKKSRQWRQHWSWWWEYLTSICPIFLP